MMSKHLSLDLVAYLLSIPLWTISDTLACLTEIVHKSCNQITLAKLDKL